MKLTLHLLIFYTVIHMIVCEVIDITSPPESHYTTSSAILDMRSLDRTNTDDLEAASSSQDPSNVTFLPWPMTRILKDVDEIRNSMESTESQNDLSPPVMRTPKSLDMSANFPSATLGQRQIIPAGQPIYPNWYEIPTNPNYTALDYEIKTDDEKEGIVLPVPTRNFGRRQERRKIEGIKRQYPRYEENNHDPNQLYESPDTYYTSSNYETENPNTYEHKYINPYGQYGSENYNSHSVENYKNHRYHENSVDYHSGNLDRWPAHYSRPNSVYPRFTVNSYEDPARSSTSPSLIGIFSAIGSSLLQLFKIGLGSGLSIAVAIIAIKLFLIPLKIIKFLKIIKILFKLFFVIPFILRTFAPTVYSAIGTYDSGFANKMEDMPTPESRDVLDKISEQPTLWDSLVTNITSALPDVISAQKCSSRVACELGSYLGNRSTISEQLTKFLVKDNPEEDESKDFDRGRIEKEEVTRAFLTALTQRWNYDQCDVFTCGMSL